MKYVFFGTPEFAAIVLEHLLEAGYPPLALICNPDRPFGRKRILTSPPTKELLLQNKVRAEILQPEKLDDSFHKHLKLLHPDFFIVTAYSRILPASLLTLSPQGAVGVHPSLLPRLRGASPIQSAILEGEPQTGVTLYLMDALMDHGPIIAAETLSSYDPHATTTPELSNSLAHLGGTLLAKTLPAFIAQKLQPKKQEESQATFTKKFKTEDGFVSEETLNAAQSGSHPAEAQKLGRMIRALNPEPGVWTIRNEKRVKLLRALLRNGRLELQQIQIEGKKPQTL